MRWISLISSRYAGQVLRLAPLSYFGGIILSHSCGIGPRSDLSNFTVPNNGSPTRLSSIARMPLFFSNLGLSIYATSPQNIISPPSSTRLSNNVTNLSFKFSHSSQKIIPFIEISVAIYIWIIIIVLIKVFNIICGYKYYKKLTLLHTTVNKIY